MNQKKYFKVPAQIFKKIYAYSDTNPDYNGLLKIGETTRTVQERISEQHPIKQPFGDTYKIELEQTAIRSDGTFITDKEVRDFLVTSGKTRAEGEWVECTVVEVEAAILSVKERTKYELTRSENFKMRPEQVNAVERTQSYFLDIKNDAHDKPAHFLWNAKMRFGKTFATYQLTKRMGWKRILVLTFKPAVETSWREDLYNHKDFSGWKFSSKTESPDSINSSSPLICFGSFQDYLGKNSSGGIKVKNQWVHDTDWDCVVLDEYHYGAWRENSKDLFEAEDLNEVKALEGEGIKIFDRNTFPIKADHFLYLSGTPFRALESGEFIEEQIFNWTYSDEQEAKRAWSGPDNPYDIMPSMVLLTYQMPNEILAIAQGGEFDEFDLNEFFSADGDLENAQFKYPDAVQAWLNIIRGADLNAMYSNLKIGSGSGSVHWPFKQKNLLKILRHTFWFLPSISSCYAMKNLLIEPQNKFYHDFEVVVAAGKRAGVGVKALPPVLKAMGNPQESSTIVLSCGKLTTGVSVRPWSGMFMLRNLNSPETYFQAAFRVQTPWFLKNLDNKSPNKIELLKHECYVFDFAPSRALRQIMDYSCRLSMDEVSPEKKVSEFIKFLPVLAFDGGSMREIDAAGILDIAMSGTSATLLARRWESSLLVNVDNSTLERILHNPQALDALMQIEGFRSLNEEINTIINKTEHISSTEKSPEDEVGDDEKKEVKKERTEIDDLRKKIQKKLIKFATRIPIFMYLTDYREETLQDVITKLEPELFKKVTGIGVQDFRLLVSLNVFNSTLMNDAVYKFKRYEDASFDYLIKTERSKVIGLWETKMVSDF